MLRGLGAFGLFATLAPACVSTRLVDEGVGGGGNFYAGDRDAGADASVTTVVRGLTPVTTELRNQLEASACAGSSSEAEAQPSILTFVVDVSSSMGDKTLSTGGYTKWEITRDSLQSAVNKLPQATSLGLLFFPNLGTVPNQNTTPIDVSNCVNTPAMIAVAPLGATGSSQRQAVTAGLQSVIPQGGTPTLDAYTYALDSGLLPAITPVASSFMVLITDGEPTIAGGCEGSGDNGSPVDFHPIIQAISDAWTNFKIRTFVIGSPGSEKSAATGADVRSWLSAAATAGQTPTSINCSDTGMPNFCHLDMSQVSDFSASFQQALQSITGQVLSCQYSVPAASAGNQLDPTAINVLYAVNGDRNQELLIGQTDASCSGGNGWYLDASNSITLCQSTCKTVQQDPAATVRILAGCQSITLIN